MNRLYAALFAVVIASCAVAAYAADPLNPAGGAKAPAAKAAPAAEKPAEITWGVRCDKNPDGKTPDYCEAFQSLMVKEKESGKVKRVAEFAIGFPVVDKKKKEAQGVIIMPFGVMMNQKVKVIIDDKQEFEAEPRFCVEQGCLAFTEISNSLIDKMLKAQKITVKSTVSTGQPIEIIMGMKGFPQAIQKIRG